MQSQVHQLYTQLHQLYTQLHRPIASCRHRCCCCSRTCKRGAKKRLGRIRAPWKSNRRFFQICTVPWVEVLIVSPPRFEYISFYSGVRIMLGSCCEEQEAKEAKARAEHRAATRLSESRLLSSQRVRQELYDALRCAPCTAIRKTFVFLLVHPCQPASLLSLPGSEALFAAHPRRLTSIESTPVHIRPRPSHLESFSTSTCPSVDAHRRRPTHTFAALRFDTPRAPRAATAPTASAVRLGSSATSRRRSRMMPTSPRPRAIAAATTTTSATTLTSKLSSIR